MHGVRLFTAGPRSIRLRDAAHLKHAVESMLQLLFNDYGTVSVASKASLSRARRKVDVAMMFLRRRCWRDAGFKGTSVQLGFLSMH